MTRLMAIRVLHVPGIAGGNAAELARAERAIGLDSWCVALDANPMGYEVDERHFPQKFGRFGFELLRWRLLWRAWRDYDVIHFNFGQTLMPAYLPSSGNSSGYPSWAQSLYRVYARAFEMRDLSFLKARGKSVFMTYQGDDARQGDYCRDHFPITFAHRVEPSYYTAESDAAKRRRIDKVDCHADGIFALNPDLLHVLPQRARFLPYANVDIHALTPVSRNSGAAPPVLVHAPSHPALKGTDVVLQAIDALRAEGLRFEFVLVQGKTRAEALNIYRRADLCIDQLFAGWYGGLAVEMMALGIPVLSYLREPDLVCLPPQMCADLPLIRVEPQNLTQVLREWLAGPRDRLRDLGVRSRSFVERWHDPLRVAGDLRHAYEEALRWRAPVGAG